MPAGLKESDQEGNADLTLSGRASATCLRNWGKRWGTYFDKKNLSWESLLLSKGEHWDELGPAEKIDNYNQTGPLSPLAH